jgi:hypothetical protein
MTPDGVPLSTVRIVNDPHALAAEVAAAGARAEVVLEATYGWYWAVDALADVDARVHLAHPLRLRSVAFARACRSSRSVPGAGLALSQKRLARQVTGAIYAFFKPFHFFPLWTYWLTTPVCVWKNTRFDGAIHSGSRQ